MHLLLRLLATLGEICEAKFNHPLILHNKLHLELYHIRRRCFITREEPDDGAVYLVLVYSSASNLYAQFLRGWIHGCRNLFGRKMFKLGVGTQIQSQALKNRLTATSRDQTNVTLEKGTETCLKLIMGFAELLI